MDCEGMAISAWEGRGWIDGWMHGYIEDGCHGGEPQWRLMQPVAFLVAAYCTPDPPSARFLQLRAGVCGEHCFGAASAAARPMPLVS